MPERGILYIVSGNPEIVDECVHSAASLKRHHPRLPVQVISDKPSVKFVSKYFDFVDIRPEAMHPLKAKVRYLLDTRFQTTAFLDADTEVRMPIGDLFAPEFNLSITHDNLCDWNSSPVRFFEQESDQFNTGLLVYDSSAHIRALFSEWYDLVSKQDESEMRPGHNCDQVYLNRFFGKKLHEANDLRLRILPNDVYNVRPWCWPSLKEKGTFSKVKILHAHHLNHSFFKKAKRKFSSLFTS